MGQINVIRHLAFEDLGCFEPVLVDAGFSIRYLEAGIDDLEVAAMAEDMLIILGGPISANDVDEFPFLQIEIDALRHRIENDLPTLGICLGAQLIARAAGSEVYAGERKEIGWSAVRLTAAGSASPLKVLSEGEGVVLHWHGETFDLPPTAELLASSEATENQAFRIGGSVYGLQFHLEVSATGLERWLIGHIGEIESTEGISVGSLRQQTAEYAVGCEREARRFMRRFMQLED